MATDILSERQNLAPVDEHLQRQREAIAAKEREITEAEAELASLAAEDAKLCAAINENRRMAAIPEPQATDFEDLSEWHAAARKWRSDHAGLDEALAPIERERNQLAGQRIPDAKARIAELRREHAWLEFGAAKEEHRIAQLNADTLLGRVKRLQGALASLA